MITKKILEKEIEFCNIQIITEKKLENGLIESFSNNEISYEEFMNETDNILDNIYRLQQKIESYKFLIIKYC